MTRLRPVHRSLFLPSISHSIRPSTFRLLLPALSRGRAVMLPLQRQKPVFPVSSSFTALRRARPRSPQRAQMALHLPPFPSRSPRRKLSALRTQHRILSQPVHPSIWRRLRIRRNPPCALRLMASAPTIPRPTIPKVRATTTSVFSLLRLQSVHLAPTRCVRIRLPAAVIPPITESSPSSSSLQRIPIRQQARAAA